MKRITTFAVAAMFICGIAVAQPLRSLKDRIH